MRGKVSHSTNSGFPVRITPAYAGKRIDISKWNGGIEDHPRLCGEKGTTTQSYKSTTGSPPPMRGKVKLRMLAVEKDRITPAYAGKSILLNGFRDNP